MIKIRSKNLHDFVIRQDLGSLLTETLPPLNECRTVTVVLPVPIGSTNCAENFFFCGTLLIFHLTELIKCFPKRKSFFAFRFVAFLVQFDDSMKTWIWDGRKISTSHCFPVLVFPT